ncbi:hypothetical protein BC826DRAFT_969891 [Russula brevipes]|nr:hypothetical protein BC826DRAFT_969891 [Russula brevipes]
MFWFFTTRQETKMSGSTTPIYDKALRRYKKTNYRSTEVGHIFDELAQKFCVHDNFELRIYLHGMIHILIAMSDVLERRSREVIAFPPAKAIFIGICGFLTEAYDLEASYGTIIDNHDFHFTFLATTPIAAEVQEITEKVIAEFIFILAMLTKAAKRGTIGTSKIQDAMNTMDLLTWKLRVDHLAARSTATDGAHN